MSSVDNRIVEMEFDNKQFESGVKTSLGTIEKLKKSLNFTESVKSLTNLEKASNSLSLNGIADAMDAVTSKFSIFGTIGDQIIRDLTSKVMGLVYQFTALGNSFTVTPIISGWGKYESVLNAQQQILNAVGMLGKDMGDVEKTYEKLSWYSDETNYSTQDMINALAQFTSAGVTLEDSEKWILGIANAAAFAGVQGQAAAHAFEGWSKAVAAGFLDTRSWMWIKTSGMATSNEFKQIALDAAVAVGTLKKLGDKYVTVKKGTEVSAADFANALSEGWFNKDVMNNVFSQFGEFTEEVYKVYTALNGEKTTTEIIKELGTDMTKIGYRALIAAQEAKTLTDALETVRVAATAKWTGIYKAIFGNYDESRKMWTDLAEGLWDVFVGPVDELKIGFEKWHNFEWGGFQTWINALYNFSGGIVAHIDAFKEAFDEIFPVDIAETLRQLAYDFGTFALKFKIASEDTEKFSNIFKGFFSLFKLGGNAVSSLWRALKPVRDVFKEIASYFYGKLSDFGAYITEFTETLISNDSIFNTLRNVFSNIWTFFSNFVSGLDLTIKAFGGKGFDKGISWFERLEKIIKPISGYFSKLGKRIKEFFGGFKIPTVYKFYEIFSKLYKFFSPFIKVLGAVKDGLSGAFKIVGRFFTSLKSGLKITKDFMGEESAKKTKKLLNSLNHWLEPLGGYFDTVKEKVSDFFKKFIKVPNAVQFFGFFKKIQTKINDVKDALSNFFTRHQLPSVDKFKKVLEVIGKILSPFSKILFNVRDAIGRFFDSFISTDQEKLEKRAAFIEKIGNVIDTLWTIIKAVAGKIGEKLAEIGGKVAEIFTSFDTERFLGLLTTGGLVVAIQNFIGNVIDPIRELFDDEVGIFSSLKSGMKFSLVDHIQSLTDTLWSAQQKLEAGTVFKIALSVGILAAALIALASVDQEKLIGSAVAIGVLAGILAGVMKSITGFFGDFKAVGNIFQKSQIEMASSALLKMAAAVFVIALAIKKLADIEDPAKMAYATIAIIAITSLISGLSTMKLKTTPDTSYMKNLIAFAISIRIIASAISAIADVDPSRLLGAVLVVGAIALVMAAFVKLTQTSFYADTKKMMGNSNSLGIGTAYALVGMASAILIMVAAIWLLGNIKTEVLQKGVIALTAIMTFVAAYFYVMSSVQHINLSAVAFIGMAIGIAIMAGVLKSITKIKGDVGSAVIVMAAMVGIVGLYLYIAAILGGAKMAIATVAFIGIAAGFVVMASALMIFAAAIKVLSTVGNIGKTIGLLAATLGIMAVGLTLMIAALPGAAALIVASAALMVLAPVLIMFGQMSVGSIIKSLIMLAGAFAIFYAVGKLFKGEVSLNLLKFAGALLVLGAAVALAGVGMTLLGTGFAALAATFTLYSGAIGKAVEEMVLTLLRLLPTIVAGVGNAAFQVLTTLRTVIPYLIVTINDILAAVLDMLESSIPRLIEVGMKILVALLQGIDSKIYLITVAALSIIGKFIMALAEKLPMLIDAGINLMISFINSLARGIEENTDKILNAIDNLIASILIFAISALQRIVTVLFPLFGSELSSGLEDAKELIRENLSHEEMEEIGAGATTHLANGMINGGGGGTFGAGEELGAQGTSGFESTFGLFNDAGLGAGESGAAGLLSSGPLFEEAGGSLGDMSLSGFTGMLNDGEFDNVGSGLVGQIINGQEGEKDSLRAASEELTFEQLDALANTYPEFEAKGTEQSESYISGIETTFPEFKEAGGGSIAEYLAGVDEKDSSAYGAFVSVGNNGKNALRNVDMAPEGRNAVIGYANAANSPAMRQRVYSAFFSLGLVAKSGMQDSQDMHSPSREMAKLGRFSVLGFINGVNAMSENARKATKNLGEETLDSFGHSIKDIVDFFDSDPDASPVIKPVLDLSNVESGTSTIPRLLNGYSMNVAMHTDNQLRYNRAAASSMNDLSDRLDMAISKIGEIIQNESDIAANTNYRFEIPFSIDGRELARASAVYNQEELNRLTRNIQRKEGYR